MAKLKHQASPSAHETYDCPWCGIRDALWRFVKFWGNREGVEVRSCKCPACEHAWQQVIPRT